jgi:hypothetical protein
MAAGRAMRNASGYLSSSTTRLTASSHSIAANDLILAINPPASGLTMRLEKFS